MINGIAPEYQRGLRFVSKSGMKFVSIWASDTYKFISLFVC